MSKRPNLTKGLYSTTFRSFYYMKEELTVFCRNNDLPTVDIKTELTERIAYFLALYSKSISVKAFHLMSLFRSG